MGRPKRDTGSTVAAVTCCVLWGGQSTFFPAMVLYRARPADAASTTPATPLHLADAISPLSRLGSTRRRTPSPKSRVGSAAGRWVLGLQRRLPHNPRSGLRKLCRAPRRFFSFPILIGLETSDERL